LDDHRELRDDWFTGVEVVAVTAGASAPEHLVQDLIAALRERGYASGEELDIVEEDVRFHLPAELGNQTVRIANLA
jgi:4-hydroxy-3-methylbut-2-en-1-yl diphosphate reductase